MCDYSVQDISDCILPNQRFMSEPESGERGETFSMDRKVGCKLREGFESGRQALEVETEKWEMGKISKLKSKKKSHFASKHTIIPIGKLDIYCFHA